MRNTDHYQRQKNWPDLQDHDLAIDNQGNIYIGDILHNTIQKFVPEPY
jgi:hypothetical protein